MKFTSKLYKFEADAELDLIHLFPPFAYYTDFIQKEDLTSQLSQSRNLLYLALSQNKKLVSISENKNELEIEESDSSIFNNYHIKNLYDIYNNFYQIWKKQIKNENSSDLDLDLFILLLKQVNCFDTKSSLNLLNKMIENIQRNSSYSLLSVLSSKQNQSFLSFQPYFPPIIIIENFSKISDKTINSLDFSFSLTDTQSSTLFNEKKFKNGIIFYYNLYERKLLKKNIDESERMKNLIDHFHYPEVFFNGTAFVGRFSRIVMEEKKKDQLFSDKNSICELISTIPTPLNQSSFNSPPYISLNSSISPLYSNYNLLLLFWLWIPFIFFILNGFILNIFFPKKYSVRA